MLDGLAGVVGFGIGLGEQLVRLNLLLAVAGLFAQFQELLSVLDRPVQLALRFVNHADLLVALSLDILVLCTLGHT